ncbi:chromosomal replication initiator protein DnaA [Ferrithrix thermotolerans DSM 19514]|uniref:Chromosomal replication initiator protein DnaA n=1 Tax=Ferrithrix thermotolerans DSM 19514 TaxID=1121881 RepID=A0A1M4XUA6_9ACTN|nr:chromosomal replication initiator protein DnaA [Ferrithrix thermotolerans]SHE96853.1 chromosomal replication initiator protein DnaA [Ferrithrix thermotolerans DSM 19514]
MEEVATVWGAVSARLRDRLGDATWNAWFYSLEPTEISKDTITLSTPSTLVKERIQSRYLTVLNEVINDHLGEEMTVRINQTQTKGEGFNKPTSSKGRRDWKASGSPSIFDAPNSNTMKGYTKADKSSAFDERYSFDTFVIGPSNRFAHAAALSVAEQPASTYNPLFIHGDAGLGKTHLLMAIGNYLAHHYPGLYVRYVSTESFLNEFVNSIRQNKTSEFKARYRQCDVLLVDDVQFLENKEAFQEEFFHTFNSLYGEHKQIVLTSDRPPRALATLEDRLKSRFVMGLTTDIQAPDLETRMAIVSKKVEELGVVVPTEVVSLISTSVKDNIRELEGALTRVTAFANLTGQPITESLTKRVLADLVGDNDRVSNRPTVRQIVEATSHHLKVTPLDIYGDSRKKPIATARQIAMYLTRELTEMSYPVIGKEFGGRDHTTVMHAVDKISKQMQSSREIYDQVTEIHRLLRCG